jgi:Ca-activated chloride channel family protein
MKKQIKQLTADGGTAIDEGLRLGIEELAKGKQDTVSQAFLLTDGENEHGDNDRCLKFAQLAASYNLTLNTLVWVRCLIFNTQIRLYRNLVAYLVECQQWG